MRFGPFPERDIEPIQAVLNEFQIEHQVVLDQELVTEYQEEMKNRPPSELPHPHVDPACHYIEFDEKRLEQIGDKLEVFGITPQVVNEPDFDAVDYFCPTCGEHSVTPGMCPKHKTAYIPQEEYNKLADADADRHRKVMWKWSLGLIILGAAYYFLRSYF